MRSCQQRDIQTPTPNRKKRKLDDFQESACKYAKLKSDYGETMEHWSLQTSWRCINSTFDIQMANMLLLHETEANGDDGQQLNQLQYAG